MTNEGDGVKFSPHSYVRPEKDDDVQYMKIERPERIILVVNADRKTAQQMAKRKYGLRSDASILTRWTDSPWQGRDALGIWLESRILDEKTSLRLEHKILLSLLYYEEDYNQKCREHLAGIDPTEMTTEIAEVVGKLGVTRSELADFISEWPDSQVKRLLDLDNFLPSALTRSSKRFIDHGFIHALAEKGMHHLILTPVGRVYAKAIREAMLLSLGLAVPDADECWGLISEAAFREISSSDREYLQSVRDDFECLTAYQDPDYETLMGNPNHDFDEHNPRLFKYGLEGNMKPDKHHMFKGKECCQCAPHGGCGISHYVVTRKANQPDFSLTADEIHFAYATTICSTLMEPAEKFDYGFPQGFHTVLPILHDGEYKFSQNLLSTLNCASDFIEMLFHHPSDPNEENREIVVFYEENNDLWMQLQVNILNRFEVPLDDPKKHPESQSLYEITGFMDEHTYLRRRPFPKKNGEYCWLETVDWEYGGWAHGIAESTVEEYQETVEDWYNLAAGLTTPATEYYNWHGVNIGYVESFLAEIESAQSYYGEIIIDEMSEGRTWYLNDGKGLHDHEQWLQNLPQLWIYLMRVFSCYQLAQMYCATFLSKQEKFETLGDRYITVSHQQGEFSFSARQDKHKPELQSSTKANKNRPLTKLVNFIIHNQGENFEIIIDELRDDQHTGENRMILYEHIISQFDTDDIAKIVSSLVPWDAIKRKIEQETGGCNFKHGQQEEAVSALLQIFGYPIMSIEDKPDIGALQEKWRNQLQNLPRDCTGAAVAVAREIEWYLRVCVRGSIRDKLLDPKTDKRMKKLLDVGYYDLSKRNLGNLVNQDLEPILGLYDENEKYAKQTLRDALVSARNSFGHPDEETPHLSNKESKEKFITLLESAIEFIDWLEKSSISTPIPVIIKSVKSTEHGYYEIEAIKSSGFEKIYIPLGIDKDFEVGETWYVIPKSNPLRIEPLMFRY